MMLPRLSEITTPWICFHGEGTEPVMYMICTDMMARVQVVPGAIEGPLAAVLKWYNHHMTALGMPDIWQCALQTTPCATLTDQSSYLRSLRCVSYV